LKVNCFIYDGKIKNKTMLRWNSVSNRRSSQNQTSK